ncbi:Fe-S oxidoreductase [Microbacterium fluvii]|uniref:Fe-S oxidoreductase n=1 Tax=Microbacterium fluvii TaxID=415215 RepID=A0ABW2H9W2_9MICO|nr:Fe-S oxidoreductase [Microbacterium fluvii]MCU4671513.1 Fe-S oxidoreductase [Microbacterium fluvii]
MSPIAAPPTGWRQRADRAVARGRALDRLIPAFLLDSAVSRLGYLYGTAVGFAWGGLWSTGRVERREGLWVFRGLPAWAFRRGGVCVGGCYLTGDARVTDRVLRHEAVHKRQWERYGLLMPVLYALAGRDPLRNRFEIEAGLEDGNYLPRNMAAVAARTASQRPNLPTRG